MSLELLHFLSCQLVKGYVCWFRCSDSSTCYLGYILVTWVTFMLGWWDQHDHEGLTGVFVCLSIGSSLVKQLVM